jgi:hypothetical protein
MTVSTSYLRTFNGSLMLSKSNCLTPVTNRKPIKEPEGKKTTLYRKKQSQRWQQIFHVKECRLEDSDATLLK